MRVGQDICCSFRTCRGQFVSGNIAKNGWRGHSDDLMGSISAIGNKRSTLNDPITLFDLDSSVVIVAALQSPIDSLRTALSELLSVGMLLS